jgi:tetratricopeptide (TPR) repeat protein/tRNA A-37 threonylcarbamoyl transferase component Bud32/TolB-like protein
LRPCVFASYIEGATLADLQDSLATSLGSAYRIERELGGGGMSRVFLAEETALGRQVVIKVLPPEMAAGVSQDRFRREIQLAARLQHPHIVPLLTAGSAGDLLYYVMPFIEGESLRVKLAREGELPVGEAARILREVTDALSYAHKAGLVHRDIKPDNVMLSHGHALVTDFGVAKAVTEATGAQSLTSLGMALGTPAYMSPEQASGSANVDQRADLYALGAMAYEMLTGEPPFSGSNPQAVLAAHVTKAPTRMSVSRPAVPPALEAVIMRCLEKHAADRWQTAADLLPQFDLLLTPSGGTQPTAATAVVSSGTEKALRKTQPVRVAGLFAVGAIAVLGATWWLAQRLGLPNWVIWAAAVLLVAGLPVMLIAAKNERRRILARGTGQLTTSPPGLLGRLTTLRGAVAGGGFAFGGLAAGAASFMALRVLGVGPFATLVSAGVLKDRDPLLVAEFANRTADSTLAGSITEAFRIDLAQSRTVRLVGPDQIAGTLQLMQRDAGTRLTEQVAREIAQRAGAKGVVAGEIAPLAGGFVLSIRLVSAADGSTLLAGRETADGASGIIKAVEKLSRKLREGIGESLRTIRGGPPLAEVTTGSLEALKAYSDGARAADYASDAEAIRLLQRAVTHDSNFAMAWRKLGVAYGHLGTNPEAAMAAVTRAYQLRGRLSPREADHTEAYYFSTVAVDPAKTIEAYERLLASWPDDDIALVNLAETYGGIGRLADMERLTRRAVALGATDAITMNDLLASQVALGETAAADSTLALHARVNSGNPSRLRISTWVAQVRGQTDRSLAYADSLCRLEDPHWRSIGHDAAARTLRRLGRLRESERRELQAVAEAGRAGEPLAALRLELDLAEVDLLLRDDPDAALKRVEAALAAHSLDSLRPANRPYGRLIALYAMAGRAERAEALQQEYQRLVPELIRAHDPLAFYGEGQVALARGNGRAALAAFRRSAELLLSRTWTLLEQGRAFERLEQPDSAIAAYEALATLPTLTWEDPKKDFTLAPAYRRLGELSEARGNRGKAREYYGKFVTLWKDADPELQPRVVSAKQRLAALATEARN